MCAIIPFRRDYCVQNPPQTGNNHSILDAINLYLFLININKYKYSIRPPWGDKHPKDAGGAVGVDRVVNSKRVFHAINTG